MTKSTLNPSVKLRGRPPIDSEQVNARLPRDILEGIDAFAAEENDKPNRTEALRRIVRDWLIGHGFLKEGRTS